MALIKTVNGKTPVMGKCCYLAENATLVGDVVMGESVVFGLMLYSRRCTLYKDG